MTDTITAATKTKTAKPTASFQRPDSEFPTFDLSKQMAMPEQFREIAEQGAARAKETYEKAKEVSEEITDLVEETYATAAKGATDYNLKVIEIARTNTKTAFGHAQQMLGVKSPSEFVELSASHARERFETMTAQTKELAQMAHKVASDIAEPIKAGVTRMFNQTTA